MGCSSSCPSYQQDFPGSLGGRCRSCFLGYPGSWGLGCSMLSGAFWPSLAVHQRLAVQLALYRVVWERGSGWASQGRYSPAPPLRRLSLRYQLARPACGVGGLAWKVKEDLDGGRALEHGDLPCCVGWVSAGPRPATWFLPTNIPWVTGEVLAACRRQLVPWLGQQHPAASCWLSLPAHN